MVEEIKQEQVKEQNETKQTIENKEVKKPEDEFIFSKASGIVAYYCLYNDLNKATELLKKYPLPNKEGGLIWSGGSLGMGLSVACGIALTGKKVFVRMGRFGALAQIGEASETEKPQYASLKKGQFIESITLEDALELFKLPREVGIFEDLPMVVALGRFGPYM